MPLGHARSDPLPTEPETDPTLPRRRDESHVWAEENGYMPPHEHGARCVACNVAYCHNCPPELYRRAYLPCDPYFDEEEPDAGQPV